MDQPITNSQKHDAYTEQMGRLNRALKSEFYLEAIFIEYAVVEDRIESVLRHSGKFNPEKHNTLDKKLSKLSEMQRAKNGLVRKYFSDELIRTIYDWKSRRNPMVHALMKQQLHTSDLASLAFDGQTLIKTLSVKTRSYNNMIAKQSQK